MDNSSSKKYGKASTDNKNRSSKNRLNAFEKETSRIKVDVSTDVDSPIYASEIGKPDYKLEVNSSTIFNGIIMSEILGKPKSKRGRY